MNDLIMQIKPLTCYVLKDDFDAFSYECMKCEHRYKTFNNTIPKSNLETLFNIENQQKLIKYSQEIK